jgi:putative ABC transport system substrate-binding protein
MRRREFITLLGSAAAAWPLVATAQPPVMPVIGYLSGQSPAEYEYRLAAFRQGLNETGYVEHRNVGIEYRWAQGQYDRLPAFAADLVRRQVSVIVATGGTPSALAAKAATATIPIVFNTGGDPVKLGLVSSFNRPGGNVTGVSSLSNELAQKRLELLHELVPTATVIGVLVNPTTPTSQSEASDVQTAARTLRVRLLIVNASAQSEFDAAFATLVCEAGGLVVGSDPLFGHNTDQLIALAERHAVPTIYSYREDTAAGGLMSYGTDHLDSYRQAGVYIGRILKGDKPADLPVQQITKIELVINMKTAKALGLTFPLALLGRADAVIE